MFRAIERGSFGPTVEERKKSAFTIVATAWRGSQSRTATVTGRDPYGLTATLATHIALLLEKGNAENVGAVSPSMVAGRQAIMKPASAAGVTWQVGEIGTT
jgi:hypothetical protein